MEKIKVVITNAQNDVKIPVGIRMLLRRCCNALLTMEKFEGPAQVDITFVNEEQIRELNNQHRNIDKVTDVLSFPLGENGVYDKHPETGAALLGDIVICVPKAFNQAEEYDHSVQREMAYLTAHSMLHLLGYDHEVPGIESVRMREKEEAVMTELGLPRSASYIIE